IRDGATRCHSMRDRSSAYSYASVYSSASIPASRTNRTWLAYPSSYSSTTSTRLAAETHSGYLGKSQMTSAIRARGAAIVMDCVEVSAMLGRLPRRKTRLDDTRPVDRRWVVAPGRLRMTRRTGDRRAGVLR